DGGDSAAGQDRALQRPAEARRPSIAQPGFGAVVLHAERRESEHQDGLNGARQPTLASSTRAIRRQRTKMNASAFGVKPGTFQSSSNSAAIAVYFVGTRYRGVG